jgi:predicted MFS family arabinose efflux permease
LLIAVCAIVALETMFFSSLAPLLPYYIRRLGLGEAGAGFAVAAYSLGAMVGVLPTAVLVLKIGVRATASVGLVAIAGTSIVFALADSVWLLDLSRLAQGASSTLAWGAALAWLADGAPPARRGELIGIAMGSAIAGTLLGPPLGALASGIGTVPVFAVASCLCLALAFALVVVQKPAPRPRRSLRALLRVAKDRRVAAGMWLVWLAAFLSGAITVLAPIRLDHLGVGAAGVSATFVGAAVLGSLGAPAYGRWLDRSGPLVPIRSALVIACGLGLALAWAQSPVAFALLAAMAAGVFMLFWVPGTELFVTGVEQAGLDPGTGFSLWNLAWPQGAIAGSAGVGALAGAAGEATAYVALAGFCAVTAAVTLALRTAASVPLRKGSLAFSDKIEDR